MGSEPRPVKVVYSGSGHSAERTTSLQWTKCVPPANNSMHPKKGQPDPNNGQNTGAVELDQGEEPAVRPQRVHCSEVPLYTTQTCHFGSQEQHKAVHMDTQLSFHTLVCRELHLSCSRLSHSYHHHFPVCHML